MKKLYELIYSSSFMNACQLFNSSYRKFQLSMHREISILNDRFWLWKWTPKEISIHFYVMLFSMHIFSEKNTEEVIIGDCKDDSCVGEIFPYAFPFRDRPRRSAFENEYASHKWVVTSLQISANGFNAKFRFVFSRWKTTSMKNSNRIFRPPEKNANGGRLLVVLCVHAYAVYTWKR